MRLFGLEIRKAAPISDGRGAWWPLVREAFTGAWQRNEEISLESALSYHAVFTCVTLISQDIGKLRPKLVELDSATRIWSETQSAAFSPVLRKPNDYQNHIQFKEWWILSKLLRGNTYALKRRDARGVVNRLYLLDPSRVKVLVAPDGSVFYELAQDNLSELPQNVGVPAGEIIHDRMNCLFHPLVGVSPIFACGMAANLGLKIQSSSAKFFGKGANPSGVLTAPTTIDPTTAKRLSEEWARMFSGDNSGAVAVLGDNLKFEPMRMSSVDAQLIEQLKWSSETVCATFHVPPFKAGIGAMPTYPNAAESLNQIYYNDCLQSLIESFELCMDEGLGLTDAKEGKVLGVELDLDGLLRMDTGAQIKSLAEGVGGAVVTPNEARKKMDLKPLSGGDTVYMQQQNYSLEALNRRDTREDPFASGAPEPPPDPAPPPATPEDGEDSEDEGSEERGAEFWETKALELEAAA